MKLRLLSLLALLICFLLAFTLVSCDDGDTTGGNQNGAGDGSDLTGIGTRDIILVNGVYTITVKNAVKSYDMYADFLPKLTFNEGVSRKFSTKADFSESMPNKLALNEGDNFVYLKVSDGNGHSKEYKFNIHRNKMLTVTFDPAGGTMDKTTYSVEEKDVFTAPSVARVGYKFDKWSYDFKNPITENITVVASWIANEYTITVKLDGESSSYKITFGEIPVIAAPSKEGYNFAGWKMGNGTFDASVAYSYDRDIEIEALFEIITYNIQYILGYEDAKNNEKNPAGFDVTSGDIELLDPSYDDKHIFLGWYTDATFSEESKITKITSEMAGTTVTLYAKWNTVSKVEFDANEGECDTESTSIYYNESYTLPTPKRDNYVFDGWYNGDVRLNNTGNWTISGDVTLVAKWTPRQNSIEYVLGGENAQNNVQNPSNYDVEDGEVELLAPSYDDKHIFVGWYTEPNFSEASKITHLTVDTVTDEMILYAKWDTVSTVTFVTDCDETLDPMEIVINQEYTLPTIVKANFTFAGWFDENGKQVYGTGSWTYETDVVLTAKWTATEYQINMVLNGGSYDGQFDGKYTVETDFDTFVIPTPSKTYAAFGGWYLDAEFTQAFEVSALANLQGTTIYAKWDALKVTINYDADGGSISSGSESVNLGEDYVLLSTEKPGYVFDGWYLGDELMESQICWTNADELVLNLKAKWTVINYTIKYDLDGGKTAQALIEVYNVASDDIVLPTPTKDGYLFAGWKTDDDTVISSVTIAKGSTGNRSYKAVWITLKDDSTGLLFSYVDGKMVVVGIDRKIDDKIKNGVKIPAYFYDIEVVAIDSSAFKAFGEEFTKTSYANMSNSYVTFFVPTTVKKIGANAFESCNGIKVSLYDPDNKIADHKEWDKTVTWESGNRAARDCIWGFRPAIGWTRYSKVNIPEGYDEAVPN